MPLRPLDKLNAIVVISLLILAAALAAAGRLPEWRYVIAVQVGLVAALAAILLVARMIRRTPVGPIFNTYYPLLLVPQVFGCLQPMIDGLGFPNQDAALVSIDRAMLGGRDAAELFAPYIRPWLNDLLFLAYGSFFLFPLAVGVPMWLRSRRTCTRFVFAVVLGFYVSYAGYFLVPARGPRYFQYPPEDVRTRVTAISRFVYDTLNSVEYTKDDVFPSGHVLVTAICVLAAWRFDRRVFWGLLPVAVLLVTATLYCRYHYLIDVIVGFALACVTLPAAGRLHDRWEVRSAEERGTGSEVRVER